MSDLICRKTMQRCQTAGMCMPHGGCRVSVLADCDVRYSSTTTGPGDTIDKAQIKALAQRVTTDRRFCRDDFHVALAAGVLALLAESERLEAQVRLAGVAGEMAVHEAVGRAATDFGVAVLGRDQLKVENEQMRSFLAEVSRTSGDKWAVMTARNLLKELGHD
ncbi:hypothetical protein [Pseudomonas putida]|uniref:hypothetical protein n=1 Tax=Pseudomonas putida TaxID=303 RepID=UPI00274AF9AB|nr:hypothetical protein [Pseudomonas putida]MDP9523725.1 hypothetical protein [Pseudomonas putida]